MTAVAQRMRSTGMVQVHLLGMQVGDGLGSDARRGASRQAWPPPPAGLSQVKRQLPAGSSVARTTAAGAGRRDRLLQAVRAT